MNGRLETIPRRHRPRGSRALLRNIRTVLARNIHTVLRHTVLLNIHTLSLPREGAARNSGAQLGIAGN